jgi:hypothetical protein
MLKEKILEIEIKLRKVKDLVSLKEQLSIESNIEILTKSKQRS